MQISKTDFIQYLHCPKSLWLLKHKTDVYPHGEFSDYAKKLAAEGYEVEAYVRQLIEAGEDAAHFSFQTVFQADRGLYAKADMVRTTDNRRICRAINSLRTPAWFRYQPQRPSVNPDSDRQC